MGQALTWIGIFFCLTQSAMFSGLNLAFFSFTRLRLEIEAEESKSKDALNVLKMREDSNFLLTTILWGNVGINVLLTLLSDSVMAGVVSFLFSTFLITLFGEIVPQAYFSRHSLKMASLLAPVLKGYQFILFPVAKPSAMLLDVWLGRESIQYFAEKSIKLLIKKHIEGKENEIGHIEGTGAINFLTLDDIHIAEEGEDVHQQSIIQLDVTGNTMKLPKYDNVIDDPFLKIVNASGEKWVVFTNSAHHPIAIMDADGFLRSVLFHRGERDINEFCFKPHVIKDGQIKIGEVIKDFRICMEKNDDRPIEQDVVLLWTSQVKRIITGADILGRLLKGI